MRILELVFLLWLKCNLQLISLRLSLRQLLDFLNLQFTQLIITTMLMCSFIYDQIQPHFCS